MIFSVSLRRCLLVCLIGLFVFLTGRSRAVPAAALEKGGAQPLLIWHSWKGEEAASLKQMAADYPKAAVDLVAFDTEEALLDALRIAASKGNGPDLFFGPDTWRDELLSLGLVNGYCLPGECPECEGTNPPFWCHTAQGDFSLDHNRDFSTAGLCDEGKCAICQGNNPPSWCWAAEMPTIKAPDIFQAELAAHFPEGDFPVGTPLYWDFTAVAFNTDWFTTEDIPVPDSLAGIVQLANQYPKSVYIAPSLAQDPDPQPMRWFIEEILAGDPDPQPNLAAVLVFPASQMQAIYKEVSTLLQMPMADYRPVPQVQGIYASTQTKQKELALDFAAYAAAPDFQLTLYKNADRLPVNDNAWASVADERLAFFGWEDWLMFGENDWLAGIDPRDFIEWPDIGFDLGSDPCSNAAEALFASLIDFPGAGRLDILRAAGDAVVFRGICQSHLRQLEADLELGTDYCSNLARWTFAQRLSEVSGVPGAVDDARMAAINAFTVCRGG